MNETKGQVMSFAFFDDLNGIPEFSRKVYGQGITIYACLWYVTLILITGCTKISLSRVPNHIIFAIMLFFGWLVGHLVVSNMPKEWINVGMGESLVANVLPILVYHVTYRVDYNTLVSNLGLIFVVSVPILLYHYGIIILISYTVLNEEFRWGFQVAWLFAVGVGIIEVDYCVSELNRVQGQMRVLQLVLLGERFISFAVASLVHNIVVRYYNPTIPTERDGHSVLLIIGWTLAAIVAAVLYAQIFRFALKYFYKDIVSQATMTITALYLLFWSMEAIRANGCIGVLCFGIATGYAKIKYSSAAERFFTHYWNLIYFVLVGLVYATVGFYLGVTPHWIMPKMWGYVFLIYILVIMARGLGFITVYHLVSRFGCQLTMKHFIIATLGVNRSTLSLAFVFLDRHFSHGYILVQICTIINLASAFFNVAILPTYLAFFDMYRMSRSRVVNMNVALAQVNECREKCIRSLKMDRLIADSNWLIVDGITRLPHPYAGIMDDPQRGDFIKGVKTSRTMKCVGCETENPIPPTQSEYENMLLEAKQRILKAQLVCFWKQHENGTLTRQGVTILNNLIEGATVKEDPKLTYKDLRIQREGSTTLRCMKRVFGHLFTVTSVTHRFIPTNIIRASCFRLCTLRSYRTVMACLAMVDIGILLVMLRTYYFSDHLEQKENLALFFQLCDFGFFALFLIDFLINILGIGVVQYFCIHVNKIDFLAGQLIRANEIAMYMHTCYIHRSCYNVFLANNAIFVQKVLMLVRISRIYVFIVALIPKIMVLIDKKLDQDLMKYYDIGKAYLISLNRVAYFLNHIADNDRVYNELMVDVELDRQLVTRELGMIQIDRPTIAVSNKTLHAIRHVIICMGDCISNMKDEGLLDPTENRSLVISLEKVKRRLLKFNLVQPTSPEVILNNVPWLCDDHETSLFLLKHAKLTTYQEGEKIIYYGDDAFGLYVLVSGMVKCLYITSPNAVKNVTTHGMLPNCDYFTNLLLGKNQQELIVSGHLLGELGIVTGRRYDMDVICETRVQLYYIPWKILKVVIHNSGNAAFIQAKIWKNIGIKIAVHLLHDTARFQGWQDYRILLYLERGIVPLLDGVESLHMSEFISDVILIEGKLMDYASRKVYTGPMCIPRVSSQRLILPGTPSWNIHAPTPPRILIIPNVDAEMEDIMSNEGIFKYGYQQKTKVADNSGEQRSPQSYISRLVQAQRRRRMVTQFMDYMPTIQGPVEGLPVSSTYIEKTERYKHVKAGNHPRTRTIDTDEKAQYTQDIEEQSEIQQLKDDNEDDETSSVSKRGSKKGTSRRKKSSDKRKKSSAISYGSRTSSFFYQSMSRGDVSKKTEIVLVEDSDEEEEALGSKYTQTNIYMRPRTSPAKTPEILDNISLNKQNEN